MEIVNRIEAASHFTENKRHYPILTRGDVKSRPLTRIDTIMLHQTGFDWGNAQASYDMVIAHYMVLRNGVITQVRPLTAILNDARGGAAVHIECVGDYPAPDDPRPTMTPTLTQIRATRWLVRHIHEDEGLNIRYILGHYQYNTAGRPRDPGPHLWYNVGLWAKQAFGLSSHINGKPEIPASWESARFDVDPRSFGNRESWTCFLRALSRAIGVKRVQRGVIGIYATQADADAEKSRDRPWHKPTSWECWIRRPTHALEVELMDGGIVGFYLDRRAAEAEADPANPNIRYRRPT